MPGAGVVPGFSAAGMGSLEGTLYCSSAQRPKSISLQRSEQKGREGLLSKSTGFPQVGHFIIIIRQK